MMNIVIFLLATYGLTFIIRNSDGPFDLIIKARRWLIANKYVGVFFFKLLDCPVCTGFYSGLIIYLITAEPIKLAGIVVWALAGSAISLLIDAVLSKLHQ